MSWLLLSVLNCAPKSAEVEEVVEVAPVVEVARPTLATIDFPVDPAIADAARGLLDVSFALQPWMAADAGLSDDAIRVPSYTEEARGELLARIVLHEQALGALDWDALSIDEQIDVRWLLANAALLRHQLQVERRWEHRPSEWLEPVAYALIGLASYASDRPELQRDVAALIPGMLDEMRALVVSPTRRDVETASEILSGIVAMLEQLGGVDETIAALEAYDAELEALADLPEFRVIGAEAYAWRLEHAMLLPWSPEELLAVAEAELARVEARLGELEGELGEAVPATPEEIAAAEALDADGLLRIYDELVETNLARLRELDVVTVSPDLPAIKARPTPAPLIPLTGDGGSMNPPPLFGPQSVGWWNVENFSDDWDLDRRLRVVLNAGRQEQTWFGPYAVHEGVPGHHLQLAEVRANPDPIRTLLGDGATIEGWGLYAEELFWEHGGFGDGVHAELSMLRSYRARIRRVVYDVKVETEVWDLQQAAEWRAGQEGVEIDRDVLRAIQWPTQLIGYFAGKHQIMLLREKVRAAQGEAYSEKAFHDAVLGAGLVPLTLVEAKLLGEPIPRP